MKELLNNTNTDELKVELFEVTDSAIISIKMEGKFFQKQSAEDEKNPS